jgi:hypothetical protein
MCLDTRNEAIQPVKLSVFFQQFAVGIGAFVWSRDRTRIVGRIGQLAGPSSELLYISQGMHVLCADMRKYTLPS